MRRSGTATAPTIAGPPRANSRGRCPATKAPGSQQRARVAIPAGSGPSSNTTGTKEASSAGVATSLRSGVTRITVPNLRAPSAQRREVGKTPLPSAKSRNRWATSGSNRGPSPCKGDAPDRRCSAPSEHEPVLKGAGLWPPKRRSTALGNERTDRQPSSKLYLRSPTRRGGCKYAPCARRRSIED
jgi:hypothetical protein